MKEFGRGHYVNACQIYLMKFRKSKQQITEAMKSSKMKKTLDPKPPSRCHLSRQRLTIIVVILVVTLLTTHPVQALRQCLQPTPMAETANLKADKRTNSPGMLSSSSCEVPQIPTHIWHQTPCHLRKKKQLADAKNNVTKIRGLTHMPLSPVNNNTCCTIKDVCTVIAHALLADYGLLDVVFLPAGACRGDIFAGNFTRQDAARVVAPNIRLVILQVNGTELVQILEETVFMGLSAPQTLSYTIPDPHSGATNKQTTTMATMNLFPVAVAGIQANLAPMASPGSRVITASILSPLCAWELVDPLGQYTILTAHELTRALPSMERNSISSKGSNNTDKINTDLELLFRGHGRHGRHHAGVDSHWELQDAVWLHAKSACTIQDPYMHGKSCHVIKQSQQPRMCRSNFTFNSNQKVILSKCPSQPVTTSSGRDGDRYVAVDNKKQPTVMTKSVNYTQLANVPTVVVLKRNNHVVKN